MLFINLLLLVLSLLFNAFIGKLSLEEQHVLMLDDFIADYGCPVFMQGYDLGPEGKSFGLVLFLLFPLGFCPLFLPRFHSEASLINV